jgi:hypothetical protein
VTSVCVSARTGRARFPHRFTVIALLTASADDASVTAVGGLAQADRVLANDRYSFGYSPTPCRNAASVSN